MKSDEQGSILVSTFGLLLFLSFLISTVTVIITNQTYQLRQISYAYEAKAMIEMTRQVLEESISNQGITSGRVEFHNGEVKVTRKEETTYELEAILDSGHSRKAIVSIDFPENEEDGG